MNNFKHIYFKKFAFPAFLTLAIVVVTVIFSLTNSSGFFSIDPAFGYNGGGAVPPTTTPAATTTTPAATTTPPPPPGTTSVDNVVSDTGVFTQTVVASSVDNKAELNIQQGVVGTVGTGGPPITQLTIVPVSTAAAPPPPVQPNFTGTFIGVPYDFGPDGAVFDKPITITFDYVVPSGFNLNDLVIAFFDKSKGVWVELTDIVVNPQTGTISGKTTHFTTFSVIAKKAAAAPTAVPTQTAQPTQTTAPQPTQTIQPTKTTAPAPTQGPVVLTPTTTIVTGVAPTINWILIGSLLGAVVLITIFLAIYLRYRHD